MCRKLLANSLEPQNQDRARLIFLAKKRQLSNKLGLHIDFIVVSTKAKQMAGITFDTRRLSRNLSRAKKEAVGKRGSGVRNPEQGFRSGRQMNGKHTHTIRFPLHKSFVISFK